MILKIYIDLCRTIESHATQISDHILQTPVTSYSSEILSLLSTSANKQQSIILNQVIITHLFLWHPEAVYIWFLVFCHAIQPRNIFVCHCLNGNSVISIVWNTNNILCKTFILITEFLPNSNSWSLFHLSKFFKKYRSLT